nr:response regulator [uncultured Desulfobacter sp.]
MSDTNTLILIVDDNTENIQFMGSLLMANDYQVGVAHNGIEALTFCETKLPDLILLDIIMPQMDGYKFCEKLKKDSRTSHIPVIFVTAKTETPDIVKGFNVGGVDYVSKPFIPEELLARVKTHVEMKQLRHLIPICSVCKKVRDVNGYWKSLEAYIEKYSDSTFTHSMCAQCGDRLYGKEPWYIQMKKESKESF